MAADQSQKSRRRDAAGAVSAVAIGQVANSRDTPTKDEGRRWRPSIQRLCRCDYCRRAESAMLASFCND